MGKKRPKKNSDTQQVAKLALATAILTLITQLISLARQIVEWLAKP